MDGILINPYVVGPPVGNRKTVFVGRKKLLAEVKMLLRDSECSSILLYGQRRIGKTSILQFLEKELKKEDDFRPVFFDLHSHAASSLGKILNELADTIALRLNLPDSRKDLIWKPEKTFQESWLPKALAKLPLGCSLVLLLDEYDVLANTLSDSVFHDNQLPASDLFEYLPALLESNSPALKCVIVIGCHGKDLSIAARSLPRIAQQSLVSLLPSDDTEDLIRLSEKEGTLAWNDAAVQRVIALTNGHPYLTQLLCHTIWDIKHQANSEYSDLPTATLQDVNVAVPEVLKEAEQQHLVIFWETLSPAERVVAAVLASHFELVTHSQLEKLLQESKVRLAVREVENAHQSLRERDLLEEVPDGFRFRVELVRRWVEQNKTLQIVQREVDESGAVVEDQYNAASKLHQDGDEERALLQVREALKTNSYHIKSRLLLSDILCAQNKIDEARVVLEQLRRDEPEDARSRLVDVYLRQAKQVEDDDRKLEIYQQVLEIDPTNKKARTEFRSIWNLRGSLAKGKAESSGIEQEEEKLIRLQEALIAYQLAENREQAQAIKKAIEPIAVSIGRRQLTDLERAEEYGKALEMLRGLNEEYPSPLWVEYHGRLQSLAQIQHWYKDAMDALMKEDRALALTRLLQVLNQDPEYKDAALRFYESVTGINPAYALASMEEARQQCQRMKSELRQARANEESKQSQIADLENKIESTVNDVEVLRAKLMQTERAAQDKTSTIRTHLGEIEQLKKREATLQDKLKQKERQLTERLESENDAVLKAVEKCDNNWQRKHQQLQAEHEELKRKIKLSENKRVKYQEQLEANRKVLHEHTRAIAAMRSTADRYKVALVAVIALLIFLLSYAFFIR